jgi:hypothetical protein
MKSILHFRSFKKDFSAKKPDLLLPRIADFIQKYFLPWGRNHDRQTPDWKPFQLLERHCAECGYDFLETKDMVEERIARKLRCECEILRQ